MRTYIGKDQISGAATYIRTTMIDEGNQTRAAGVVSPAFVPHLDESFLGGSRDEDDSLSGMVQDLGRSSKEEWHGHGSSAVDDDESPPQQKADAAKKRFANKAPTQTRAAAMQQGLSSHITPLGAAMTINTDQEQHQVNQLVTPSPLEQAPNRELFFRSPIGTTTSSSNNSAGQSRRTRAPRTPSLVQQSSRPHLFSPITTFRSSGPVKLRTREESPRVEDPNAVHYDGSFVPSASELQAREVSSKTDSLDAGKDTVAQGSFVPSSSASKSTVKIDGESPKDSEVHGSVAFEDLHQTVIDKKPLTSPIERQKNVFRQIRFQPHYNRSTRLTSEFEASSMGGHMFFTHGESLLPHLASRPQTTRSNRPQPHSMGMRDRFIDPRRVERLSDSVLELSVSRQQPKSRPRQPGPLVPRARNEEQIMFFEPPAPRRQEDRNENEDISPLREVEELIEAERSENAENEHPNIFYDNAQTHHV
jgi:hypothetical protein